MPDITFATNVERDKITGTWSADDERYEDRFRSFMGAIGEKVISGDQRLATKPTGLVLPEGLDEEKLRRQAAVPHIRSLSIELMRTLFRADTASFTAETWAEQTLSQMDTEEFDRMSARTLSDTERTMPIAAMAGAQFILDNCQDGEIDFAFSADVARISIK